MKSKGQLKWWQISAVVLILLILAGSYSLYLYIPTYIETSLLPKISKELGTTIEASVRRFGTSGADLENVVLTNADGKLRVDSIRLDYKLKDLFHAQLAGLTISGADLSVKLKDNHKISIEGIDLETLQKRTPSQKKETPWAIDKLALKNCNLNFSYHNIALRIPFHAQVKSLSNKLDKCMASGQIYPFGQTLSFSTSLDSNTNKLKCHLQMPHFNTILLGEIIAPQKNPKVTADIALKSNLSFTLSPFTFEQGSLKIEADDLQYKHPQTGISFSTKSGQTSSIKITAQGSSAHLHLKGLHISAPLEATVTTSPSLTIEGRTLKVVGTVGVTLPKNLKISQNPEKLNLHYRATINKETHNWQLTVNSELAHHNSRVVHFDNQQLSLPNLNLQVQAKGDLATAKVNYNLHSNQFNYQNKKLSIAGNQLNISGNLDYTKKTSSGQFELTCSALKGILPHHLTHQSGQISVGGNKLKVSGKLNQTNGNPTGQLTLSCDTFHATLPDGHAELSNCKITDQFKLGTVTTLSHIAHKIELSATDGTASLSKATGAINHLKCELATTTPNKVTGTINIEKFKSSYPPQQLTTTGTLHLPFSWPLAPSNQEGSIKLDEITYNGKQLGTLSLNTAQKSNHYKLSGALRPSLLAGATVQLSAIIDKQLSNGTLDYQLNKIKIKNLGKVEKLIHTNTGIDLNGWLSCHGQIFYQNGVIDASTDLALNDANIALPEEGDKLEGVNLWLAFPSLRKMKSEPKQYFSFDKAHVGKLKLGKSLVEFQLEAKDKFFLEKCNFSWCGGTLFSHALRFNPLEATMKMVLFCKDIHLNALAQDFYDMDLETTAMLSGSIPLWLKDDQLYFQKGLLYTVPGKLGKIKVKTENILTKSLTKSMPQYGKLSFVENAMKDFNYDWVKFVVRTDDTTTRTLQASLSFFGKPNKKLKFTDNGTAKLYDPLKSPPLVPQINVNIDYKLFDVYKRYKKVIGIFN